MRYILLVFSAVYFFSFSALSQTFFCERIKLDPSGFTTRAAAASWFNENVTIIADLEQKTASAWGQTSDLWIREDNKRMKAIFIKKTRSGKRIVSANLAFLNKSDS